jgi:hypothetical protein
MIKRELRRIAAAGPLQLGCARPPRTPAPRQAQGALLVAHALFMPQTGPGGSLGDPPLTYRWPFAVLLIRNREEMRKFFFLSGSQKDKKSKTKDTDSTTYQL